MVELDKDVIEALFNQLKELELNNRQMKYVKLLETKFHEFFTYSKFHDSDLYNKLTPTELKVANLIKIGNTSKEIANLLNLSTGTVVSHRNNIRKKLGIRNKKISLRIYLMTH